MTYFFSVALQLSRIEIGVIVFTGLGFIIMFGISSAKGGYQDLVKSILSNDNIKRNRK
tara:strand:- start:573 stop:746 length:174 start_codon:yes stop_codon:yes gene_type:complete